MDIPRNWRLRDQRYRLQGTKCTSCGERHFPPRQVCPRCKGRALEPYVFKGRGTVYSYTVVYQAPEGYEDYVPYVVALVDLEEGVRVTAQLTDISPDEVSIGMPVEMVVRKLYEEGDQGIILYGYKFRPLLTP